MADFFTDAGEDFVADLFDGTASAPANYYIGWGTGGGTAAKSDTALTTPSAEARVIATESQPASNQNRFVGTITSASTQSIDEAGVFTASTAGTMPLLSDFTPLALENGDSIEFTFTLTWD